MTTTCGRPACAAASTLSSVGGIDAPIPGLDEAVQHELIRVGDRAIAFVHPLIRSAVEETLGPAHLAQLHTAAAALTEDPRTALMHRARASTAPDGALAAEIEATAHQVGEEGNWLG